MNFAPALIVTTTSVTDAEITSTNLPSSAQINSIVPLTVGIINTGTATRSFKIGLSVGKSPSFCDVDCYVSGGEVDPSGIFWFAVINNLPVGGSSVRTQDFNYTSDFFTPETFQDTLITVRPLDSLDILDSETIIDSTFVTSQPVAPLGVTATIINVTISDENPVIEQEVDVNIVIKNTGNVSFNFTVGFSIGKNSTGVFCNRDCYSDGKGDYVQTGLMFPEESVIVTRKFVFRDFAFTAGEQFDTLTGVYHQEFLASSNALDLQLDIEIYEVIFRNIIWN